MAKRKRLTAAERRNQLVRIGRGVFGEKGFDGTSVEEIATRAGVSKPIVYEHFGGKEGLYAVIVDREMERVVSTITEAISTGTPRERVERAALAFLTYVRDEPDGFAVLSHDAPSGGSHGSMWGLLNEVADRVGDIFVGAFKDAGFSTKGAPIYAHALVGMVTFVGQWSTEAHKPKVEELASHISALAWMGLRHLPRKPDQVGKLPKPLAAVDRK
jgi:AcrR family transcriptional regulator